MAELAVQVWGAPNPTPPLAPYFCASSSPSVIPMSLTSSSNLWYVSGFMRMSAMLYFVSTRIVSISLISVTRSLTKW